MGSINLKHTGSGSAIALSSDGTNLLLDGTAIGGGGGSPDLFNENYTTGTKPSATGANAIATGRQATATGVDAFGHGVNADAAGQYSVSFGVNSEATGISAIAMGRDSVATGAQSFAGTNSRANGQHCTAFSIGSNSTSYGAGGQFSVAIGKQSKTTTTTTDNVAIGKNAISNVTGGVSIAGAGYPVLISNVYSLPTADGTNGQVMTTNGSGVVAFADAGGGGADLYAANESSPSAQPSATGTNAIAIGDSAVSSGTDSFALGKTRATGARSFAVSTGTNATYGALGADCIAMGEFAKASNSMDVAIGRSASATGSQSLSLGFVATATGTQSTAIQRGLASGTDSFAAHITNSTTSYGASGANSIAMGKNAKNTASESIAIGHNCFASGANSVSIAGYYARSEAVASVSIGNYSLSENEGAVAIGSYSQAKTTGKLAFNASNSGSMSHGVGYQQRGLYVLKTTTADATQTVLTGNGSTPSASNSWVIGLAAAQAFSGTLIARQDRDGGHDYAAWEIKGAAIRNATVVDLGQAIINSLYHTSGASAWAVNVSANTTLGTIEIKVTGAASTDIDWVATIDTSEVVNI